MRLKAHAKINWALHITGVRADGYHLLDMLVQRLELADDIELIPQADLTLTLDGAHDAPADRSNLAFRAAAALKAATDYPNGAHIVLTKHIPSRAGLGGGSADAAAVLRGLNTMWGTGLDTGQLAHIGMALGADVPLCLHAGLARVGGIGEKIHPLSGAQAYQLVLLQPAAGLATREVFARYDAAPDNRTADLPGAEHALRTGDPSRLKAVCHNQLQKSAAALCPDIEKAVSSLYATGAAFSQMTGSGSAVFGVFSDWSSAQHAAKTLRQDWPVCLLTRTLAG
ncbi:MAG TPA: 4-(cytidine 5'-diphospho)-2-C-methyl-D-erythritol kinase [Clostridia bacterium]|jgi:4-diphosphocytidyl-2-C-methyl-D-erythritol kinase|nr:4-(cytidine 5'-diphospho)-2-C-methyl-D-erythritol kinase [Clostridia bacterium]HQO54868.1 4-(cytidine 5'-diphospho)-2-C-methyl-D-erythritol kinase [Clostridia bacterium]HUM61663.1 4-(cytidine 5'-diphospho)-2-C-methyl-D-erythritol kinase [Clostridia bacterium]